MGIPKQPTLWRPALWIILGVLSLPLFWGCISLTPTPVTGATRTEPVTLSREKGLEIAEAIAKETNWKVKHVDKERFHLFAERPARVMGGGNIDRWQLEVYFHESAATGKDVVSVRAIPPAGAVQDPLKIVDEFLEAFLARAK